MAKLSFTKKKNGRGFEFYHYDAEKGRGNKRLTQRDYPELKYIVTEEQANTFKNRWNQDHEEELKKLRAKRNHELKSKDFDFLGAVSGYHERQKEVNNSHLSCVEQVERMLAELVHVHKRPHPRQFELDDYTVTLLTLAERHGLQFSTIKKYRETFNKFLNTCRVLKKLEYNELRLIPKEVMQDVDRAMRNKRSTTSIKKFSGVEIKKPTREYVKSWDFKQLRAFDDFAQKSENPDWRYVSKIAYCAALMTLRRSGYLPLFKKNFRNDDQDRLCCFPEHTYQKQQGPKGGVVYEIGEPDDVKPLPVVIPIWELRLERYVRELIDDTTLQTEGANDWIFPDPRGWSPDTNAAKMKAGEIFYHPDRLSDIFTEIVAASGLPPILLKNLRHTGINIIRNIRSYTRRTDLARLIAGHKSVSTTNRHYVDRDGSIEDTDFDDLWEARQVFAERYGA